MTGQHLLRQGAPTPVPVDTAVAVLDTQQQRCQTVITRLAEWSTRVKTWCVGVLGALGGLTAAVAGVARLPAGATGLLVAVVVLVGAVVVVGCWLLDAYYLHLERHFRPDRQRSQDLLIRVLAAGTHGLTEADWRDALTLRTPPAGLRASWAGIRAAWWSLAVAPLYATLLVVLLVPATALAAVLITGGAR